MSRKMMKSRSMQNVVEDEVKQKKTFKALSKREISRLIYELHPDVHLEIICRTLQAAADGEHQSGIDTDSTLRFIEKGSQKPLNDHKTQVYVPIIGSFVP